MYLHLFGTRMVQLCHMGNHSTSQSLCVSSRNLLAELGSNGYSVHEFASSDRLMLIH